MSSYIEMEGIIAKIAALLILPLVLLAFSPFMAVSGMKMPGMAASAVGSYNWSGYAVTSATFTSVSGSWTIPVMSQGASSTTTYYAAFWVGLDGYSSNSVEQTGVLAETKGTSVTYIAWYEFYPSAMVEISTPTIKVGDVISASVTYVGTTTSRSFFGRSRTQSEFSISISDTPAGASTSSWTYTNTGTVANAQRSSAECIVETPSVNGRFASLADFGTVYFTGCEASTATIALQSFALFSSVSEITMYNYPSGSTVMSSPSGLSGGSFSVTWDNAGP